MTKFIFGLNLELTSIVYIVKDQQNVIASDQVCITSLLKFLFFFTASELNWVEYTPGVRQGDSIAAHVACVMSMMTGYSIIGLGQNTARKMVR